MLKLSQLVFYSYEYSAKGLCILALRTSQFNFMIVRFQESAYISRADRTVLLDDYLYFGKTLVQSGENKRN